MITRHKNNSSNIFPIARGLTGLSLAFALTGFLVTFFGYHADLAGQEIEKLNRFVQAQNSTDAAMKMFREGRDSIQEENWTRAADRFNQFLTNYPKDKNADAALYWLSFALKKQEKYADANQRLERLIKEYPQSSWSKDARAMRIEIAPRLGNEGVVDEGFGRSDEEIKLIALQSLFEGNPERAIAYVTDILKPGSQASQRQKKRALLLLGQHGGKQATALLLDTIRNESDPGLRRVAITALGQSNDESVLRLLMELATTSKDSAIAKAAVFAISQQGNERASGLLRELARTAASASVRHDAIFWLGQRGGESVIDDLMGIYNTEQDEGNRKQVLFALSQVRGPLAAAKLLEIARSGDNLAMRKQAVFWLGQSGDSKVVDNLIALYDTEKSIDVKEQIIFALEQSGEPQALRKVMDIARKDPSVDLRKNAVFWLGQSSDPEARKFIEGLLK